MDRVILSDKIYKLSWYILECLSSIYADVSATSLIDETERELYEPNRPKRRIERITDSVQHPLDTLLRTLEGNILIITRVVDQ